MFKTVIPSSDRLDCIQMHVSKCNQLKIFDELETLKKISLLWLCSLIPRICASQESVVLGGFQGKYE